MNSNVSEDLTCIPFPVSSYLIGVDCNLVKNAQHPTILIN